MSFKTFSKILPVIFSSVKGKNPTFNRSFLVQNQKVPKGVTSLCNHIDFKVYSTKPGTTFKQIYYGVLTPQIKAVKVKSCLFSRFIILIL